MPFCQDKNNNNDKATGRVFPIFATWPDKQQRLQQEDQHSQWKRANRQGKGNPDKERKIAATKKVPWDWELVEWLFDELDEFAMEVGPHFFHKHQNATWIDRGLEKVYQDAGRDYKYGNEKEQHVALKKQALIGYAWEQEFHRDWTFRKLDFDGFYEMYVDYETNK